MCSATECPARSESPAGLHQAMARTWSRLRSPGWPRCLRRPTPCRSKVWTRVALYPCLHRTVQATYALSQSLLASGTLIEALRAYWVAVQRPREQAVDSEVFAHLTDRGVELAKKLAHGGKVPGRLARAHCTYHSILTATLRRAKHVLWLIGWMRSTALCSGLNTARMLRREARVCRATRRRTSCGASRPSTCTAARRKLTARPTPPPLPGPAWAATWRTCSGAPPACSAWCAPQLADWRHHHDPLLSLAGSG
jgi:hypothetical protein